MRAESGNTAWYDDPGLLASLPVHMRLYAAYSRRAVDRRSGLVRGGSLLFRLLRRLTPWLRLPREATVTVAGRRARVDLTDQRVLWVFGELRGGSHEHRLMRDLLRPGDTFLDIGAHHGSFAILSAELVGARGRIVAVEPQPRLARPYGAPMTISTGAPSPGGCSSSWTSKEPKWRSCMAQRRW